MKNAFIDKRGPLSILGDFKEKKNENIDNEINNVDLLKFKTKLYMLFDENGFLKPYEPIEMSLQTFQEHFTFNAHRERLFERYLSFVQTLQAFPIGNFSQWIDGSYTTRLAYPKDIDLVNFVDSTFYLKFESRIIKLSNDFKGQGLDIYWIANFPENDFKSAITLYRTQEYLELYNSDRLGRRKGFIHLKFE